MFLQLLRCFAPSITTIRDNQEIRNIREWADLVISQAQPFQERHASQGMERFVFRFRPTLSVIECWITKCHSGCCCSEDEPTQSVRMSEMACTDWSSAWPVIIQRMRCAGINSSHILHDRILIESHPGSQSFNAEETIAHLIIIWCIKQTPAQARHRRQTCVARTGRTTSMSTPTPNKGSHLRIVR